MKKSRAKEDNPVTSVIRPILLGVGVGVVACLMLLLLSTFAFVSSKHIPRTAMAVLTLVIAAVSSFVTGLVAAKALGKRGLLCGALAGGVLFLICLICGAVWVGAPSPAGSMTRLAVMALGGGLGGFFAVRKR